MTAERVIKKSAEIVCTNYRDQRVIFDKWHSYIVARPASFEYMYVGYVMGIQSL